MRLVVNVRNLKDVDAVQTAGRSTVWRLMSLPMHMLAMVAAMECVGDISPGDNSPVTPGHIVNID